MGGRGKSSNKGKQSLNSDTTKKHIDILPEVPNKPQMSETERLFREAAARRPKQQPAAPPPVYKIGKNTYTHGDTVRINTGNFKGLLGEVVGAQGGKFTVRPLNYTHSMGLMPTLAPRNITKH